MFNSYENIFLFVILLLIVMRLFELKEYFKDNLIFTESIKFKNILTIDECKDLINTASKIKFETYNESVDSEAGKCNNNYTKEHDVLFPVYQIDILIEDSIKNHKLWDDKIRPIYFKKIKPLINKLPWVKDKNVSLEWVFIKRYKKCERTHMRSHFDSNYFTFNILLSNPKDFKGGELYIFDSHYSIKYKNISDLSLKEHDAFIKEKNNNLPIIKDYDQGDILSFVGENHLHGTLPIEEGERYVLVLFFNLQT
tara:strand:+ start:120 stop:878 length:759 start_codon:yes stop_codon:yes gene_type:complete